MNLLIFAVCIAALVVALIYDYIRSLGANKAITPKATSCKTLSSEAKESEQRLQEEVSDLQNKLEDAYKDRITGLPAWPIFEDKIKQSLKEGERHQLVIGLMFVDIDGFSVINDALGPKLGDEVLLEVSRRLQRCIRQVDSMARFAKDTFVLLLNNLAKPETAAVVGQRIQQAFAEPINVGGNEIYLTVCVGIALAPTDGNNIDSLMLHGDQALHLAKKKGKQVTQFYEERLHHHSQRELLLYNSLKRDNIYDELLLYFQPILENNRKIYCMEAVMYWRHPELGVILAEELFEYAARQKKSNEFTAWLLKQSCQQFLAWREAGFTPALLAIPLSIKQLENSQFIYDISQIMQDMNFDPSCLLVEIKDDFSSVSLEVIERALNMLNYLGVKLALADFGFVSLSLRYLKHFKIDYLKLENVFIDDIVMNERTQSLVRSLLGLAKGVSSEVIVQGVETDKQFHKLKELGVTLMQGPWFGQALLARDVLQKIVIS